MSTYQEMKKLALANMNGTAQKPVEIALIFALCGVIYALLAIAAAIADLKP